MHARLLHQSKRDDPTFKTGWKFFLADKPNTCRQHWVWQKPALRWRRRYFGQENL